MLSFRLSANNWHSRYLPLLSMPHQFYRILSHIIHNAYEIHSCTVWMGFAIFVVLSRRGIEHAKQYARFVRCSGGSARDKRAAFGGGETPCARFFVGNWFEIQFQFRSVSVIYRRFTWSHGHLNSEHRLSLHDTIVTLIFGLNALGSSSLLNPVCNMTFPAAERVIAAGEQVTFSTRLCFK